MFAVTLQDFCCYITGFLLLHYRMFAVTLQDVCCYITGFLLLHHRIFAVTLQNFCCYITQFLMLHYRIFAVTSQDFCCYTTAFLLLHYLIFAVMLQDFLTKLPFISDFLWGFAVVVTFIQDLCCNIIFKVCCCITEYLLLSHRIFAVPLKEFGVT